MIEFLALNLCLICEYVPKNYNQFCPVIRPIPALYRNRTISHLTPTIPN
jgi:hypothetical protein